MSLRRPSRRISLHSSKNSKTQEWAKPLDTLNRYTELTQNACTSSDASYLFLCLSSPPRCGLFLCRPLGTPPGAGRSNPVGLIGEFRALAERDNPATTLVVTRSPEIAYLCEAISKTGMNMAKLSAATGR